MQKTRFKHWTLHSSGLARSMLDMNILLGTCPLYFIPFWISNHAGTRPDQNSFLGLARMRLILPTLDLPDAALERLCVLIVWCWWSRSLSFLHCAMLWKVSTTSLSWASWSLLKLWFLLRIHYHAPALGNFSKVVRFKCPWLVLVIKIKLIRLHYWWVGLVRHDPAGIRNPAFKIEARFWLQKWRRIDADKCFTQSVVNPWSATLLAPFLEAVLSITFSRKNTISELFTTCWKC